MTTYCQPTLALFMLQSIFGVLVQLVWVLASVCVLCHVSGRPLSVMLSRKFCAHLQRTLPLLARRTFETDRARLASIFHRRDERQRQSLSVLFEIYL